MLWFMIGIRSKKTIKYKLLNIRLKLIFTNKILVLLEGLVRIEVCIMSSNVFWILEEANYQVEDISVNRENIVLSQILNAN